MKSKGFTLMELIAVVVIVSVLTLIAVPAYRSIKNRILENQFNNLVELIETTANKYAQKTKNTIALVQTLIDEGLLEADDGTYIYDPRDNSIMNCYIISIKYENGNYNSKLMLENATDCNINNAIAKYGNVEIKAYDSKEKTNEIDMSKWYKGNMYLYTSTDYDTYNWITNTGKTTRDPYLELKDQKTFNGSVTVLTTDVDENRYYGSKEVKIDNEAPKISKVELSGSENWNEERSIDINASDGNGSGIAGYYVGEKTCTSDEIEWQSSPEESYKYNLSIINQFTEEKEYHVCVKDNVENIGEYSDTITISKSDNIEPYMIIKIYKYNQTASGSWVKGDLIETVDTRSTKNYIINSRNWVNYGIKMDVEGYDGESGVKKIVFRYNNSGALNLEGDNKNIVGSRTDTNDIEFTVSGARYGKIEIEDKAGNKDTFYIELYLDRLAPNVPTSTIRYDSSTGEIRANSDSWTNRTLWWGNFSSDDNGGSGINHYEYDSECDNPESTGILTSEYSYTTTQNWCFKIKAVDNAGNSSAWSNIYYFKIDKTNPTCTNSGGSTTWTNSNSVDDKVTIRGRCDDSGSDCKDTYITKTFSAEQYTTTASPGRVCDNAGNCADCPSDRTIMIDKTAPYIYSFDDADPGCKSGMKTTTRKVTVKDNVSGFNNAPSFFEINGQRLAPAGAYGATEWYEGFCSAKTKKNVYSYYLCDIAGNCASPPATQNWDTIPQ